MPPKRGRGGTRGGARAASRTPGPRESTPINPALRSQQTPVPPRYSTAYGSPAIVTSARSFKSRGAGNAVAGAVDSVEAADRRDRVPGNSDEESIDSPDIDDDPRPRADPLPVAAVDGDQGDGAAPGARDARGSAGVQGGDLVRLVAPANPLGRRAGGPLTVPNSDSRSFTEEGQLYAGAGLGTPRPTSRSSRQETPSRTSARIAARAEGTGVTAGAGGIARTGGTASPGAFSRVGGTAGTGGTASTGAFSVIGGTAGTGGIVRNRRITPPESWTGTGGRAGTGSIARTGGTGSQTAPPHGPTGADDDQDELAGDPPHAARGQRPTSSGSGASRGNASNTAGRTNRGPQRPARLRDPSPSDGEDEPRRSGDRRNDDPRQPRNPPEGSQTGPPTRQGNDGTLANAPDLPGNPARRSPLSGDTSAPDGGNPDGGDSDSSGSLARGGRDNDQGLGGRHSDRPRRGRRGSPQAPNGDRGQRDDGPEGLFSVINNGLERTFRISKWPRWLVSGLLIWGLLILFSITILVFTQALLPPKRWEGVKVSKNYTYTGVGNWRQNILQFVPWVILHPFAVLTGNLDYTDFRTTLQWAEWNHQNNKIRLDYLAGATEQMHRLLPELIAIKVDKSSNEWSVGDSFWSALDEQMKHGGLHHSVLTLERSADGTYIITDNHWDAILRRMQSEGMLLSGPPGAEDEDVTHSDQINAIVERTLSQRWDQWLKKNDDAIKRVMGVDKEAMSAYYTELFGDFEQKMLERFESYNQEEQLITKDEFIEKIQHVSNEYDVQIRAEMAGMEQRLRHAIDMAEDGKQTASLPEGMTREQVSGMIDEAIRRAVADAQLESIAKGNIKGHLENELSGHKNYFSAHRGALVDHSMSSTSYRWSSRGIMGEDDPKPSGFFSIFSGKKNPAFREGGQKAGTNYAAGKALEKWDEDGECWCAGHSNSNNFSRIADLSILTADTVIPQHLVVEHITASGSFDPEAMPKDLEVWMRTPSDRRRRTLLEWSANIWSDAKLGNGARLMAKGFVKIGEFKYLNSVGKGEKQIFRLSEDLLDLDAQTQQIVVRSKSNYGSQDHTCFYRLQLFGKEGNMKMMDRGVVE